MYIRGRGNAEACRGYRYLLTTLPLLGPTLHFCCPLKAETAADSREEEEEEERPPLQWHEGDVAELQHLQVTVSENDRPGGAYKPTNFAFIIF